jgi:hypothetical protein
MVYRFPVVITDVFERKENVTPPALAMPLCSRPIPAAGTFS